MMLNLIEQAIEEDNKQLESRVIFSNKHQCRLISISSTDIILQFASDHEKANTKLILMSCFFQFMLYKLNLISSRFCCVSFRRNLFSELKYENGILFTINFC